MQITLKMDETESMIVIPAQPATRPPSCCNRYHSSRDHAIFLSMPQYEKVKSFVSDDVFTAPRWLTQDRVQNCRVFCHRRMMVQSFPSGGIVAEIGTYKGEFAKIIYDEMRPKELHIFDVTFENLERQYLNDGIENGSIILHEGDSSTEMAKLRGYKQGLFDWIYIDGDHTYEGVRKDIEQAKLLIKRDGLLIFNDYTLCSTLERCEYGVPRAVNDLILDEQFEMVCFAFSVLGYHDVAVRRQPILI
jgi:hypothetical protein